MGGIISIAMQIKKIVILVDQMHSHGGIERLVAIKANYWSDVFNFDVTIICTEQEQKPIVYPLNQQVKIVDLAVNYIRNKSYFSLTNLVKLTKNVFGITRFIRKEKPDFVLVASHIPITYILPFLPIKSKIIKEFHFTKFYRKDLSGFGPKLTRWIESKYDYLVCLSEDERHYQRTKNTVVIPNPIKYHTHDTIPLPKDKENWVFAMVRFAPVKNLEAMISIWNQFIQRNKSWKLHIFGSIGNDYYQHIVAKVEELKLSDSILFMGETNDVRATCKKYKWMMMTSEQECFPMVILEANEAGVPVVSYDCPTGPRNIIHSGQDGILVPMNQEATFIIQMEQLIKHPDQLEALAQKARENASYYALETVMEQWKQKIFNQ
ncbi:MAG: hypothetical protein RL607_521 [Bacteroidota bacterium]|jgi:glycosyltransferase involved in cell wall biosynthesis